MRENCRADDIVVAMHRVGRPQDGNGRSTVIARSRRCIPKGIGKREPLRRQSSFVPTRATIAAIKDGPETKASDVVRRNSRNVGHDHLPDLLFDRHGCEQCVDPLLNCRGLAARAGGVARDHLRRGIRCRCHAAAQQQA